MNTNKKNVFVDCGAFNGCSIRAARNMFGDDVKIFSFECLPKNIKILKQIKDITLIEKAVWIKNEKINFYCGKDESGTLYRDKKTGNVNENNYILVDAIDFSEWCEKNLEIGDYNILKLNVEGAEYDILDKLNNDAIIPFYFKKYYIQWHYGKIPSITKEQHDRISNYIKWEKWEKMIE